LKEGEGEEEKELEQKKKRRRRKRRRAGHQWITPVILVIQEAKIKSVVVQSQPRKIVHETLS
jgi:hypothetical protein